MEHRGGGYTVEVLDDAGNFRALVEASGKELSVAWSPERSAA